MKIADQTCLEDTDFIDSVLKTPSVLRFSRLAVFASDVIVGSIGAIDDSYARASAARLNREP